MKLSARNQLKGKVVSINKGAVNSIVSIDIGGGNIIVATISCAAVEELGLEVGSDAYAVIKADVYKRQTVENTSDICHFPSVHVPG